MSVIKYDGQPFDGVIESGLTLVDFFAEWCGPCKMIAPVLEKMASDTQGVKIVKLDVDHHGAVAQQYQVMSIPTLILFKDGKMVDKKVGFMPEPLLRNWIESNK